MPKLTAKQDGVRRRFIGLWHAKYSKSPSPAVVGVALSLITGELGLRKEEPEYSPVAEIVPLLRQAVQE
jgi:hypothetical protein